MIPCRRTATGLRLRRVTYPGPGGSMESADEIRQSLLHFNQLESSAQLTYVWEQGYFLAGRPDPAAGTVRLYQVGAFFVEISFSTATDFAVLRAFHGPSHLQPYLDQIDLDALLE